MSFSAKADMQELWKQTDGNVNTVAYCVFRNDETNDGHIYLFVREKIYDQLEVQPLMENKTSRTLGMSVGIQTCERKTEVDD